MNAFSFLFSSILLILSYPPFDLGWLAWGALVPWLRDLERATAAQAFWRSYLIGVIFFGGTIWWLAHVTVPGAILLVMALALYFGVWGWLAQRIFSIFDFRLATPSPSSSPPRRGRGRVRGEFAIVLLLPAAWAILEYLRGRLFTGFGWNLLAHTQWNWIPIIQIVDLTGVWGVSFLIVLVNAALYLAIRVRRRLPPIAFAGVCMISALIYGNLRLDQLKETHSPIHSVTHSLSFKVAVLQGNIPQTEKWDEAFAQSIWERYEELTLKAAGEKPDLIIWPETAVPGFLDEEPIRKRLTEIARAAQIPLLVGAPVGEGDRIFNSAILVDAAGNVRQEYRKLHLVPFGEYVPLGPLLSWLRKFVLMGEFSPGHEFTIFHGTLPFGVLICFEDLFPDLAGSFTHKGARWLVVITNDAWFKESAGSLQHLQASVFRAIENRVWVVRAANTGWSGFIDPAGRRLPFPSQVPRFKPGVAVAEVVSF